MLLRRASATLVRRAPAAARRRAHRAAREASSRAPAAAAAASLGGLLGAVAYGGAGADDARCDGSSAALHRNFIADAAATAMPAVVNITSAVAGFGGLRRGVSTGSGFVAREDGLVVTNAHVVAGGGDVVVTMADGRKFRGRVVAADAECDIALVQMAGVSGLATAAIGSSSSLRPGDFVVALGSPLNLSNSVTAGIVSNVARHGSEIGAASSRAEYLQTDAAINSGNSGGPLVDLDGKVIGINTMKAARADGISFAIPIDVAWAVVRALLAHGRVPRPYIGIKMQGHRGGGVTIVAVAPDSPADRAGLRPGDAVLAFDGGRVRTIADVLAKIALEPGRQVRVTLRRPTPDGGAALLDATIAVGAAP